jgi:peroxiredoxin Q/BCP
MGAKLGARDTRRTFVIGRDRRLVAEIASETNMTKHADEALATLSAVR